MAFAIAIDGPAGAGKSTIAKRVAKALGFVYVDTGAMYRAITLGCMRQGFDPAREVEKTIAALPSLHVDLTSQGQVLLNGEDVSKAIRTEECSRLTSPTSAIPQVRTYLVAQQRQMAASADVVMDGRDIGTNVLPGAQVKIFMVASPQTRAHRRYLEEVARGEKADENQILQDIIQRDYNDSHRPTDPLKQAEDAILLDTSDLDVDQVVAKVLEAVAPKLEVARA